MEQINRSELRKKIMTILYQINVYDKNKITYNIDDVIKEVSEIDNEFIKEIVYGVVTYKNKIDGCRREDSVENELKDRYPESSGYKIIKEKD